MTGFYGGDPERLSYPEAEELVARYVRLKREQRVQTSSVAVLRWSEYPNSHHNRSRVYAALERICEPTDRSAGGRQIFRFEE